MFKERERERERERESEIKKVAMPSFKKKLEKGNFSKEYHFHQIHHTHAPLDQFV